MAGIKHYILFFLIFINLPDNFLYSANFDDLYKPLLKKNSVYYSGEIGYYGLDEKGRLGDAAFEEFDASPSILSFDNNLKFSFTPSCELGLGYGENLPSEYDRKTYGPSNNLNSFQDLRLDYFREYDAFIRARRDSFEIYFDISGTRQKTKWNHSSYPGPIDMFSHIRTHYENLKGGIRYLSDCQKVASQSNLSLVKRPLLDSGQLNIDFALDFRQGELKRETSYHLLIWQYYFEYEHKLEPHLINQVALRYGLRDDLEFGSGLRYTTPFEYEFDFKQFITGISSLFVNGSYKLKDNFYVPIEILYRCCDNLEIEASSNVQIINQRLIFWQKNTDNSVSVYPSKRINYYNVQPKIKFTYLYDADKVIKKDEFLSLAKKMLLKNQWLLEFQYLMDITRLNKSPENGYQNIIDPYNVFLYPLDLFMENTEYSAFSLGNVSTRAVNVAPQNYSMAHISMIYGLTDNFNIGLKTGMRTGSTLDHFTLGDLRNRHYNFRPYCFIDTSCDWRITKNSMISFNTHVVPQYVTLFNRERDPEEYKCRSTYFDLVLALKFLF